MIHAPPMWLLDLTEEQRRAAMARDEVINVLAGPGTGKTRTLVARVADLIGTHGAEPADILVICFSRVACRNVRDTLRKHIGGLADLVAIRTFHAHALRELRRVGKVGESEHPPSEQELDNALRGLFKGARRRPEASRTTMKDVRTVAAECEAKGWDIAPPISRDAAAIYWGWIHRLRELGRVPYHVLLPMLEMAYQDPNVELTRYAHVLVDEAHDCTPVELIMALQLGRETTALFADPRQAIFTWRGGMKPDEYVHDLSAAAVYPLTRVFRFGPELVAHANAHGAIGAPHAPALRGGRGTTMCRAVDARSTRLLEVVRDLQKRYSPPRVAVLGRTHAMLRQAHIDADGAVVLPSAKMEQMTDVLVSVMRLAIDNDDRAAFTALARSGGMTDAEIHDLMAAAGARRPLFHEYLNRRGAGVLSPATLLDAVPTDEAKARMMNVQTLVKRIADAGAFPQNIAPAYARGIDGEPIPEALDTILELRASDSAVVNAMRSEDGFSPLVTIHGAKGLEWDAVVLLHAQGWPPADQDAEEHRVAYVAMTRARRELVLALRDEPRHGGSHG